MILDPNTYDIRTFSLSQMSKAKLVSALPWREPMEQRVQYKINLVIAESLPMIFTKFIKLKILYIENYVDCDFLNVLRASWFSS
jgi:hypothetical protein